jgi:hypothetical protein
MDRGFPHPRDRARGPADMELAMSQLSEEQLILAAQFDRIEAEKAKALQDPSANTDRIQIAANRRMSAALIAYRALQKQRS